MVYLIEMWKIKIKFKEYQSFYRGDNLSKVVFDLKFDLKLKCT
jgi:hypothetical protein